MSVPASETHAPDLNFERERGVYALQVTRDVAHAVVAPGSEIGRPQGALSVFQLLANAGIPVFLVKLHRTAVSLACAGTDIERLEQCFAGNGIRVSSRRDLAIVSIRAATMRELSGIMVSIADALGEAGARLYATGDSHNSVQCLIEGQKVNGALEALKKTFRLDDTAITEHSIEEESV